MSFFIPGRTTCAICGQPIDERSAAAQLPFVAPDDVPDLAPLGRGFVHRGCWQKWGERERFVAAASALLARAEIDASTLAPSVEGRNLVSFRVSALGAFRLQDLEALVVVDIPASDACPLASWLESCARQSAAADLPVGTESWHVGIREDGVELVRSVDGEVFEIVTLPRERLAEWAGVVARMCRDAP